MLKSLYVLVIVFVMPLALHSQNYNESQLAREYLRQKEFSKAKVLYERIYEKQPTSSTFLRYYIESLVGMGDLQLAEQVAKKHLRKNKNDLFSYVELGNVYQLRGEAAKADEIYGEVIDKVKSDYNKTRQLANIFLSRRLFDKAEALYLKASERNSDYQMNYELANVYYYQRNYPKMIDSYLELLAVNDQYLNTVKARLNAAVYSDTDDTLIGLLKERLFLMTQKYAGKNVFNELLQWAYVEDKEYDMALVQAFALDKRNAEQGERVVRIVQMALDAEQYSVVANGADYVMRKGKQGAYFYLAQQLFLTSKYREIQRGLVYDKNEIRSLTRVYRRALSEKIRDDAHIVLYEELSRLYAFHLREPDSALLLVDEVKNKFRLSPVVSGEMQLLEADIQLSMGNIFDATLLFAAVERSLSSNPIGSEAKLRKSEMAFYQCDFDWALGQVDVLKASTSKFIANDAARLSILITENRLEDSVEIPLCLYAKGRLAVQQYRFDAAHKYFDSIVNGFPVESVRDDALFAKANLLKRQASYSEAVGYYEQVLDEYGYEPLAAEACFFAAQLYDFEINEKQKALDLYKKVLIDYPLSVYQNRARERLRFIRDGLVN